MDALVTSTRYDGRGEAGRLAVGFYTSLSAGNLRATLVDFRQRCPQVELRMVERSRMRLVTALRNGAIDVVIATDAGPLFESKVLPLWSERILVALPEGHQLAAKKSTYWTDLRNETVLLSQYDPGRELEDLLMAKLVCSPREFGKNPVLLTREYETDARNISFSQAALAAARLANLINDPLR
jgi:DNA-binding transcriptional LysR family regulator